MIFQMIYQTVEDLERITKTRDMTVEGILFALILSLGGVVIYLYKQNKSQQTEIIQLLKENNKSLLNVNQSYVEAIGKINDMVKFLESKR